MQRRELPTTAVVVDLEALAADLRVMATAHPGDTLRPFHDEVIGRWPIDLRGW